MVGLETVPVDALKEETAADGDVMGVADGAVADADVPAAARSFA